MISRLVLLKESAQLPQRRRRGGWWFVIPAALRGSSNRAASRGASGAAGFWAPVADRMPDGWPTRLLRWPGAGAEPHDPAITDHGALVDLAAAAVADGGDVVAQSMGGVIAIGIALAYPYTVITSAFERKISFLQPRRG